MTTKRPRSIRPRRLPVLEPGTPVPAAHRRLGIDTSNFDHLVALAGNPNTGKSTVFNNLTGLRQHVGNWPGKTVARAEGGFEYEDRKYKLVDLPGTYSLLSASTDEEIARDFILFGQPDVTVIVVDAATGTLCSRWVVSFVDRAASAVRAVMMIPFARRGAGC